MTTKPKAKKFRVRRSNPGNAQDVVGPEGPVAQAPANSRAAAPKATPESDNLIGQIRALRQETSQETSTPQATAAAGAAADPATDRKAKTGATIARIAAAPPTADAPAKPPRDGEVSSAAQVAGETDMEAIRQEGLTGRQLRMARRMAQKHGLAVTSDFDAVRQLRQRGIDPFQRANMLELVVSAQEDADLPAKKGKVQLPQTVPAPGKNLPATETANPMERRIREIGDIQRDIAKRRRRKSMLLLTRLAFFVGLPTLICGWYFYAVATPMYATKSEFLIIANDGAGSAGMGGLLSGTQFATNQDAIAVQSYLMSKDAMLRLDQDVGFRSHFTQDWIDPIQRLDADASNEAAYKLYKKNIEIGYDPTEGVIRMEIVAANPEVSAQYTKALIDYAEDRVDSLSQRKREDQLQGAKEALEEAEAARRDAQLRLVELQQVSQVLDPEGRIASLRQQINNVEVQVQERELQLQALLDNARPNQAKVEGARGDIRRLNDLLARLQADMTQASEGENSLAQLSSEIQMAQADLATRDLMLQEALTSLSQTRREANAQVRYLQTAVAPVASQDPSYPRSFENTILAFLIFGGIYLLISLTASILREQVSS
ncbi:capsule biosynthesis protein [Marinovum sp.]|uniref:capsule biosynthesis protein n=1 Tax=Marinovum sp. TaxID=2024839 RepID=UPI002B26BDF5|nr:capsule biosynthesis protein [Marinovum sp.]